MLSGILLTQLARELVSFSVVPLAGCPEEHRHGGRVGNELWVERCVLDKMVCLAYDVNLRFGRESCYFTLINQELRL